METASPLKPQAPVKDIEDLTISLIIKNFNPTLLSYEFLTMSGIVSQAWELAKQPITNPRGSQVVFKNGLEILAQGNTLNFRQSTTANQENSESVNLGNVVKKYVEKMLNAEYQGLSVAPKIIVPFGEEEGGKDYIHQTFFNEGPWRNFENSEVQGSLTLSYQLEQCRLGVNINPAKLQQPNNVSISAVLFAGSFNYAFNNENPQQRINNLIKHLDSWNDNVQIFRNLVYQKFLQKAPQEQVSLFES